MAICCSPRWRGSTEWRFGRGQDGLEISELDPFLAELLRQIPVSTESRRGGRAETASLLSPPRRIERELCAEWKLYVEPELRRLFRTATETVAADLEAVERDDEAFANRTLRIPTKHADAWLNALNQARLVIAAKNTLSRDGELCDHYRSPIGSRRDLSLFQVNFYGFLQEFILRELRRLPGALCRRLAAALFSRTIAIRRSLRLADDFAGRRLRAKASCKA